MDTARTAAVGAGPLDLDDLVTLNVLIQTVVGAALSPDQSSKLKRAYHQAKYHPDGATLAAIAAAAGRTE